MSPSAGCVSVGDSNPKSASGLLWKKITYYSFRHVASAAANLRAHRFAREVSWRVECLADDAAAHGRKRCSVAAAGGEGQQQLVINRLREVYECVQLSMELHGT